jgi:hypothetical protein
MDDHRGADSAYALFERAVDSSERFEQFHEACLVRITHGAFAIWLDPFRMLDPQIVVNLLPKLGIGVDLVMHGHWLGKRFTCGAGRFV